LFKGEFFKVGFLIREGLFKGEFFKVEFLIGEGLKGDLFDLFDGSFPSDLVYGVSI
jgi:hypothetical protein